MLIGFNPNILCKNRFLNPDIGTTIINSLNGKTTIIYHSLIIMLSRIPCLTQQSSYLFLNSHRKTTRTEYHNSTYHTSSSRLADLLYSPSPTASCNYFGRYSCIKVAARPGQSCSMPWEPAAEMKSKLMNQEWSLIQPIGTGA